MVGVLILPREVGGVLDAYWSEVGVIITSVIVKMMTSRLLISFGVFFASEEERGVLVAPGDDKGLLLAPGKLGGIFVAPVVEGALSDMAWRGSGMGRRGSGMAWRGSGMAGRGSGMARRGSGMALRGSDIVWILKKPFLTDENSC